jgi:hypothetical protein
MRVVK